MHVSGTGQRHYLASMRRRTSLLGTFGPGILVAATGVGAGDLVTASLAGSSVGLVVVWAAVLGAVLKWSLNEGIARWQLATGTTLLEGWLQRLGPWFAWPFFAYFLLWSFAVGGALVSACGIAGTALMPIGDASTSRIVWGVVHSLVGALLVWRGGFAGFQRVMSAFIIAMFVAVVVTAVLIVAAAPGEIARGIFTPTMPTTAADWRWVLAVLGGVGGTVTMLSYGYWIREAGREGADGLRASRLDLAVSYAATALFGVAMVIIGSRIIGSGAGARVAVELADQLGVVLGPWARLLFLVGFWGAVFSSLLGVWQSAPYIFADFLSVRRGAQTARGDGGALRRSTGYRWYLAAIALVPLVLLWTPVREVQLVYATLGAWFMPVVALTLLLMNNRVPWVGGAFRNSRILNVLLVLTLATFTYLALIGIRE
jgi:Mn2+/Fe2+ NRAMP family transporter